jgi:ABC-2 type transport system ATP-binding protein
MIIDVRQLSYSYGKGIAHPALTDVSFSVSEASICAFLAPNGGGKTTLFKILSTLFPVQKGSIRINGTELSSNLPVIRNSIGVVFQSPGLDKRLTVLENLKLQAKLYNIPKSEISGRIGNIMRQFGITELHPNMVETLSGGYRRRVEIAKAVLHNPPILLLDEPSTGLDIVARKDLWNYLFSLRDEKRVTVLVTTHMVEEAERADTVIIMDKGKIVRMGSPDNLKKEIGGDIVSVKTGSPNQFIKTIKEKWNIDAVQLDGIIRFEIPADPGLMNKILAEFFDLIESATLSKPTLADVFFRYTGNQFSDDI